MHANVVHSMGAVAWLVLAMALTAGSAAALGPQPGDIYREYAVKLKVGDNWREFLPNPVLSIEIDDLADAVRAEALIDRWGGHPGTSKKRFRFNANEWIHLPELTTTPAGHESIVYMSQDNPIIELPLSHLREGENTFEGTCGDQIASRLPTAPRASGGSTSSRTTRATTRTGTACTGTGTITTTMWTSAGTSGRPPRRRTRWCGTRHGSPTRSAVR